jgi:hypothetical protein
MKIIDWDKIKSAKIAAIESSPCDRNFILSEIARYYAGKSIFFWNQGYKKRLCLSSLNSATNLSESEVLAHNHLQQPLLRPTEYYLESYSGAIEMANSMTGVLILEGLGQIEANSQTAYQLNNFFFDSKDLILILLDYLVSIPASLYSLIPKVKAKIPDVIEIENFLFSREIQEKFNPVNYLGLSYGEINLLWSQKLSQQQILAYKTSKLAGKGLAITPEPDVAHVGGLDLLLRDLNKIKKLFTADAKKRGLRPPKGALMWGLPGTGKSLTAKMLSKLLGVPLISCQWDQLISSNPAESLQNLELVFQLVDSIDACVLFFDELEKALDNDTSLLGMLLRWLQDHTCQCIMLATINRLDHLPPELIRRFEYIWFFDLYLHNGAMYEVFKIHLNLNFPNLWQQIQDKDWYTLFREYRNCSPSEISGAVRRTHDEIFYLDLHLNLTEEDLIEQLLIERSKFKPATSVKSISDSLAVIRRSADFARPVRGKDRSRFAISPRALFEQEKSQLPENYSPAI